MLQNRCNLLPVHGPRNMNCFTVRKGITEQGQAMGRSGIEVVSMDGDAKGARHQGSEELIAVTESASW